MTKPADRLVPFVAAFGSLISLGSLAFAGAHAAWSTAAGSLLALLNLVVLRTLVSRIVAGDIHAKLPLLSLIFVKMGVFMFLVYLAITNHWVEPIAFTVGLSSLVVGLITGSLYVARSDPRSES
jgi:ATP synthase I chain